MEPESRFYTSPVIVFDFQAPPPPPPPPPPPSSPLPSYTPRAVAVPLDGDRVQPLLLHLPRQGPPRPSPPLPAPPRPSPPFLLFGPHAPSQPQLGGPAAGRPRRLGVDPRYCPPKGALGELEEAIYASPNGTLFVKPEVRAGVLPRMLREILDTRVKRAMKEARGDPVLHRMLNARPAPPRPAPLPSLSLLTPAESRGRSSRQFGLKMIANVTYGYTAAGFSGRMPCAEIADAIVEACRAARLRPDLQAG
eukprot:tig00021038_g17512.t1